MQYGRNTTLCVLIPPFCYFHRTIRLEYFEVCLSLYTELIQLYGVLGFLNRLFSFEILNSTQI